MGRGKVLPPPPPPSIKSNQINFNPTNPTQGSCEHAEKSPPGKAKGVEMMAFRLHGRQKQAARERRGMGMDRQRSL